MEQDSYLAHHGIKGMKWGVRRFQNKDGSLTNAGKARRKASSIADKSLIFDMSDKRTRRIINTGRVATVATIGVVGGLAASGALSKEGSKYYDESTGLLLSSKKHSAKFDCLAVNMGRANLGWPGWYNNCGLCSAAYDMRRRGYNVHAGQALSGISTAKYSSWYPGCHYESVNQKSPRRNIDIFNPVRRVKDVRGFLSNATDQMEAHGPGARGVMCVQWATGGGHAIAWENDEKGRAILCESQLGIRYKNPVAKAIMFSNLNPYHQASSIVRLDNVEPDIEAMKRDKAIVNNPTFHKPTRGLKHADPSVNSLEEAIDILAEYYPTMHPTDLLQKFKHYYIIELAPDGYNPQTDGLLIDSLYYVDINNGKCSAWIPMQHKDYLPENVEYLKRLNSIEHDAILMHHGIKGMKWGIRRYEDAEGHLTPAGKRRYAVQDARKYYKINRLQRASEHTTDPDRKKSLTSRMRRTQTRSDRKHADLDQNDINAGREIVAKHRLKWASFNTAAKTALTAAGAAYLYSNPKTRALAPVALAGGAALTYGSAKKIPYYFMENHRYKQVNPKGSTNRGLTKKQQRLRKVGKAAVGAALAGAAGYALVKSGAVQQIASQYKNRDVAPTTRFANEPQVTSNSGGSKHFTMDEATRKSTKQKAIDTAKSVISKGEQRAVKAAKRQIYGDIDYDDPKTWADAAKKFASTANAVRTKGVKGAAVDAATQSILESTNDMIKRADNKVQDTKRKVKKHYKKKK